MELIKSKATVWALVGTDRVRVKVEGGLRPRQRAVVDVRESVKQHDRRERVRHEEKGQKSSLHSIRINVCQHKSPR